MLGSFPCAAWSQESLFQDISQAAGIDLEGLHHAAAIGDYDRDGFQDIYVGTKNSANKLFRNLGNMEFQEVAVAAGVDDSGNTQATIWGDFNNDGYLDLVNGNYLQSNRFYQNNGDGTFSDMTAALGIGNLGPLQKLARGGLRSRWLVGLVRCQHQQPQRYVAQPEWNRISEHDIPLWYSGCGHWDGKSFF